MILKTGEFIYNIFNCLEPFYKDIPQITRRYMDYVSTLPIEQNTASIV